MSNVLFSSELEQHVPHAGLWVCSHSNEVGYTLHRQDKKEGMSHMYVHSSVYQNCSIEVNEGLTILEHMK